MEYNSDLNYHDAVYESIFGKGLRMSLLWHLLPLFIETLLRPRELQ